MMAGQNVERLDEAETIRKLPRWSRYKLMTPGAKAGVAGIGRKATTRRG